VPPCNSLPEEQRTSPEHNNTSLIEEAETLKQKKLRFSSSTSSGDQVGCNSTNQVNLTGSETQIRHGDSGVEADLSALNLQEEDASDYFAQELDDEGGEDANLYQKSVDFKATAGQGIHDNVNEVTPSFGENPAKGCPKKRGKGSKKKEVMIRFGMVNCDGGVRQEQKLKNVTRDIGTDGRACDDEGRWLEERKHLQISMPVEVRGPGR